ncbi:MAG: AhpC/TSA family protein, partial [Myxococcales bacterium]|nr:AhpC/TSA family protein [Myxococcales bacterium]
LNTYRMDQVAEDGLGDLAQVTELGLEPTLLVQGPPEEAPRFLESLRARGVTCPAKVFPGPWELGEFLAEGGYDGCIIPDSSRNTARRAGLPMISARSLQPYLMGLDENMEALAGLVEAGRRSRRSA